MNVDELFTKNKQLEEEVNILKEKLKKYTAPSRSKNYYENHKEEIIKKTKEYKETTNYYATIPIEKKKEYARTAYLNKKEKLQKEKEETNEKSMEENI
jgi:hypothetical protein